MKKYDEERKEFLLEKAEWEEKERVKDRRVKELEDEVARLNN
jgi:hypothetical protein